MTEPSEPTATAAPDTSEPPMPEATETAEASEPESDEAASLRREAANYRRQLRGVERERDALREQVDRRDRADAERIAGADLASASDLWTAGVELSGLRSEDGALSPELVAEAVADVLAQRPHWRKGPPMPSLDGGARTTPETAPAHPFGEALKRA